MTSDDTPSAPWRSIPPGVFDLIRAAVLPPNEAASSWDRWIAAHDVDTLPDGTFPVLPAVSANLSDDVLGPEADRLRGIRRRNWTETELRLSMFDGVLDVLDDVGLEVLVSGAVARLTDDAVAPGTVPVSVPEIVVPPASFEEAAGVLRSLGWRPGGEPSWSHVRRFVRGDERLWSYRWYLFPIWTDQPDDDVRLRAERVEWRGHVVRRRSPADEFIATVAAAHAPVAMSRRLLDAVEIVRRTVGADDPFWAEVRASVPPELGKAVAAALSVCRREFDVLMPDGLTDDLVAAASDEHRRRPGELGRYERYRRVERAVGGRASPVAYAKERWSSRRAGRVIDRPGN